MKITYAGQIDQPASLRLEREGNERTCDACTTKADCEFVSYCWRCNSRLLNVAAQEVAALPSQEGIVVDKTPPVAAAPTPEPSPREALREGDLVMCNPDGTNAWHPAKVTKIGDKYIHAEYAPKRVSAWDSDHWRLPTPAELAEHSK